MPRPTTPASGSGGANAATSSGSTTFAVSSGDAVYVFTFVSGTTGPSSVTDAQNNTYNQKATLANTSWSIFLHVADNVVGNAAATVTVHFAAAQTFGFIAVDVHSQANPSFGNKGPGSSNSSSYVSGTAETDSLTPQNAGSLILLLMVVAASTSAGSPGFAYSAEGGQTTVATKNQVNGVAHAGAGGAVYSAPATGGSQTLTGACTLSGTGVGGGGFSALAVEILPGPSGGGAMALLGVG